MKSLDGNQEEGREVQDGSRRVRRVVNSGFTLAEVEEGQNEAWGGEEM